MHFINLLEKELGVTAEKAFLICKKGMLNLRKQMLIFINWIDYRPKIDLENGIKSFAEWYKSFY